MVLERGAGGEGCFNFLLSKWIEKLLVFLMRVESLHSLIGEKGDCIIFLFRAAYHTCLSNLGQFFLHFSTLGNKFPKTGSFRSIYIPRIRFPKVFLCGNI